MAAGDLNEEIRQFAEEVITELMLQGVDRDRAKHLYDDSPIPEGLDEAPEYYLHESPYYWATYLLTGNRRAPQVPPGIEDDVDRSVRAMLQGVYNEGMQAAELLLSGAADAAGGPAVRFLREQFKQVGEYHDLQLPEACSGHWEARPPIAFVGAAPAFQPDEDTPRYGTAFTDWLNSYRTRFDRRERGKICWWRSDGSPGGAARFYNDCEGILTKALGEGVSLGWDAVVTSVIPYKLPGDALHRLGEPALEYMPQTLALLQATGVQVVVTLGRIPAEALTASLGRGRFGGFRGFDGSPTRVEAGDYHFIWIAGPHPLRLPAAKSKLVDALARAVTRGR